MINVLLGLFTLLSIFAYAKPALAVLTEPEKAAFREMVAISADAMERSRTQTTADSIRRYMDGSKALGFALVYFLDHPDAGGTTHADRVAAAYTKLNEASTELRGLADDLAARIDAIDRTFTFSAWRGSSYPYIFSSRQIGNWDNVLDFMPNAVLYLHLGCKRAIDADVGETSGRRVCRGMSRNVEILHRYIAEILGEAYIPSTVTLDGPTVLRAVRTILIDAATNFETAGNAWKEVIQCCIDPGENFLAGDGVYKLVSGWRRMDHAAWWTISHAAMFGPGT